MLFFPYQDIVIKWKAIFVSYSLVVEANVYIGTALIILILNSLESRYYRLRSILLNSLRDGRWTLYRSLTSGRSSSTTRGYASSS